MYYFKFLNQGNEVQERFNTAYRKHLKSGQMPFKKDVTGYLEWDPHVVFSIKPKSDDKLFRWLYLCFLYMFCSPGIQNCALIQTIIIRYWMVKIF